MSSLWTASAVAAGVLAALLIASCSERKAEPPDVASRSATGEEAGAVKVTLEPPQGAPVDLQIQWAPFPTSEGWVEPMAGLLYAALVQCGPVASTTDVALALQSGVLVAPPQAAQRDGVGMCLTKHLSGKELKVLGQEARTLMIRVAPAGTKP